MKELLTEFKREFGIVNEFSIYNTSSNSFEYVDGDGVNSLIADLNNECLSTTQSLLFTSKNHQIFLLKGTYLLAGLKINHKAVYNRALLSMKVKALVKQLETT